MRSSTWCRLESMCLGRVLFSFAQNAAVGPVDFVPGKNPGPVILKGLPLGVLICYEVIFPRIARETVRRGAEVLINITNDAWYGETSGPYQELEISRWRAIECRVPLARAANTGVSAIFDATGRECGSLALDRGGFLTCSVYPMSYLSFYVKYGDSFAWFCVLMSCVRNNVAAASVRSGWAAGYRAPERKNEETV